MAEFDGACRIGVETIPFTQITPIHTRYAVSTSLPQRVEPEEDPWENDWRDAPHHPADHQPDDE